MNKKVSKFSLYIIDKHNKSNLRRYLTNNNLKNTNKIINKDKVFKTKNINGLKNILRQCDSLNNSDIFKGIYLNNWKDGFMLYKKYIGINFSELKNIFCYLAPKLYNSLLMDNFIKEIFISKQGYISRNTLSIALLTACNAGNIRFVIRLAKYFHIQEDMLKECIYNTSYENDDYTCLMLLNYYKDICSKDFEDYSYMEFLTFTLKNSLYGSFEYLISSDKSKTLTKQYYSDIFEKENIYMIRNVIKHKNYLFDEDYINSLNISFIKKYKIHRIMRSVNYIETKDFDAS